MMIALVKNFFVDSSFESTNKTNDETGHWRIGSNVSLLVIQMKRTSDEVLFEEIVSKD